MVKNRKKILFFLLGLMLIISGSVFSYFGSEAEKGKNIPKNSAYSEFLKANKMYDEADSRFWNLIKAAEKPNPPGAVNLEELKALYVSYVKQLNSLDLSAQGGSASGGKKDQNAPWLWQVWNNKANAEVYQVFLATALKEDKAIIKKLAKSALDDYLTALKNCGSDRACVTFVGQNIDWLTRVPPSNKDGKGEGQGLGNLFEGDDASPEEGSGLEEGDQRLPFYIPGASPGKSIKGAH